MDSFCNHGNCEFISKIPDLVGYANHDWKKYCVRPNPTHGSGYGYPNRYSKASILDEARIKYESCELWQEAIRKKDNGLGQKIRDGQEAARSKRLNAYNDMLKTKGSLFSVDEFQKLNSILKKNDHVHIDSERIDWCTQCEHVVQSSIHCGQTRGLCKNHIHTMIHVKKSSCDKSLRMPDVHVCMLCAQDIKDLHGHINTHHPGIDVGHFKMHHVLSHTTTVSEFTQSIQKRPQHSCHQCEFWKSMWSKHAILNVAGQHIQNLCKRLEQMNDDVIMLAQAKSKERYEIRKLLQKSGSFYIESVGVGERRVMLIWRKDVVADILKEYLPKDIVMNEILSRVDSMYKIENNLHDQRSQEQREAKNRRYTCDACHRNRGECMLLVSLRFPGYMVCSDCIEADDEMSAYKWEEPW
jgi:hypothetical protein